MQGYYSGNLSMFSAPDIDDNIDFVVNDNVLSNSSLSSDVGAAAATPELKIREKAINSESNSEIAFFRLRGNIIVLPYP